MRIPIWYHLGLVNLGKENGYATKLLANAFNSTRLAGDDCGTKEYLLVKNFNPNDYKFRNVRLRNERGTGIFEVSNHTNASKYKGKTVEVRSPMFCRDKAGICKKCLGDIYVYNHIKENLAVYPIALSSDIMMKAMKAFHSLEKDYTKIDFRKELL